MKKIIFLYLISLSLPILAISQVDTTDMIDLRIRAMLNERKTLYSRYSEQIEKKSGFFGNQTKRDIKEANEILLRILATDTRLFNELEELVKAKEREVQKRKFEKQDKEYSIIKKEEQVQTHSATVAKLQRNLQNLQDKFDVAERKKNTYRFLFFISTLIIVLSAGGLAFLFFKKYYS